MNDAPCVIVHHHNVGRPLNYRGRLQSNVTINMILDKVLTEVGTCSNGHGIVVVAVLRYYRNTKYCTFFISTALPDLWVIKSFEGLLKLFSLKKSWSWCLRCLLVLCWAFALLFYQLLQFVKNYRIPHTASSHCHYLWY